MRRPSSARRSRAMLPPAPTSCSLWRRARALWARSASRRKTWRRWRSRRSISGRESTGRRCRLARGAAVDPAILLPGQHDLLDVETRLVERNLLDEDLDVVAAPG